MNRLIPVPDVTNSFPEYLTFYVCQRINDMQRKRGCFSLKWALEPTVRWRMVPLNIAGFMYAVSPYSPHLHIIHIYIIHIYIYIIHIYIYILYIYIYNTYIYILYIYIYILYIYIYYTYIYILYIYIYLLYIYIYYTYIISYIYMCVL